MKNNLYPWQNNIWQQLNADKRRLPHALLFHGRAGIGKFEFATNFSQSLLCTQKNHEGYACGKCASCNWFNEGNHPDYKILTPEQDRESEDGVVSTKKTKKKTQISVAQIRELGNFLNLSSHQNGGLRIIVIHPAETLNLASANALLKMLEEPATGVVFVLVAHQIQRLLPTILSRCQKFSMPTPSEAESLAWLKEQGMQNAAEQLAYFNGSPLKVLNEQTQFNQVKDSWRILALGAKLEPSLTATALLSNMSDDSASKISAVEGAIITMQKWLYDIVLMKQAKQAHYHTEYSATFQKLAENVNLSKLFNLQKNFDELRKLATHPLNHELQIESLLFEYTKMFIK